MSVVKYKPGEFCWTDIGTTDPARAKKFYQGIFGWKVTDYPMGPGDEKYSMFRVRGKDVGGLYRRSHEPRLAKTPPSWVPYVFVKNVDAAVNKAKAAGAKIITPATDVPGQGQMAVIQDPTGVVFALWRPQKQPGVGLEDVPGTVCWHDLNTKKTKAADAFYAKVFGWKTQERDFGGQSYTLFNLGKESVAGMWPTPMKSLPPSWVTHWQVANCASTVAKAKRLGGRVLMGTTPIPGMGRFAILTDPQGAAFGVVQFSR